MKKKVFLISSDESFANNYGAALQGYALYTTIQELGYDVSFIRYRGGRFEETRGKEFLAKIKKPIAWIYHKLRPTGSEREWKDLKKRYRLEMQQRTNLFGEFIERLSFYNEKSMCWSQLRKHYPIADIYVCGSDQIWNPYFKNERNDPGFFLQFAPNGAKKIAYAPSFGCNDLPPKAQNTLKAYLTGFKAISVRENSGVDIISKYTDLTSQVVLDPTLIRMPEQWLKIARVPNGLPKRYILCYRFSNSSETKAQIDKISELIGLPVVSLPLSLPSLKDDNYQFAFEAGPCEFIGMIKNAELVCTDSFHATVFSILMRTPALVFLREEYGSGDSMNSRVYSLLENLKLKEMIITPTTQISMNSIFPRIDFDATHRILAEKRKGSIEFLQNALES